MATSTQQKQQQPDPWTTGIMATAGVASAALKDSTPQNLSNMFSAGFDNSGFTVNTGAGASQSTSAIKTSANSSGFAGILGNPLILLAVAAAAYYVLKRK